MGEATLGVKSFGDGLMMGEPPAVLSQIISNPNKNDTLRCRSVPWAQFAGIATPTMLRVLDETETFTILNWNHYSV